MACPTMSAVAGGAILAALAALSGCSRDGGEREVAGRPAAAEQGPTGKSASAGEAYDRGMRALHAFWYEQAIVEFDAAIAADPTLTMAHWGAAMSRSKLFWGEDDVEGGRAALGKLPPSSSLAERERAWVRAAAALFGDGDPRSRRMAFAAAMERLHAEQPDDESATWLALALLSAYSLEDPAGEPARERARELTTAVFERNPKHPGAAHYLIHAHDTPELASRALAAARAYAASAPEAFHARHMPAHIFSRLGMWKEALASCHSAWDASVAWARRQKLPAEHHDWHSLNWIIEINFERGRRADAAKAMQDYAEAVKRGLDHKTRSNYAYQVASYIARTGEWQKTDELLAALEAPASDDAAGGHAAAAGAGGHACGGHAAAASGPPFAKLEHRAALSARLRAAAMQRKVSEVERLMAEQTALDAELRPFMQAALGPEGLADDEKRNAQSDAATKARARGNDRALLTALVPLAERARNDFAAEGTAGGILAQEEIGDVLLRLGRAREALAAYELVLSRHAGRAHSLLGAARAAAAAGQQGAARGWYARLLEVWREADEDMPGRAEAIRATAGEPGAKAR